MRQILYVHVPYTEGRIQSYMMNGRMMLNQLESMALLNAADGSFPRLRGKRDVH